MSGRGPDGDSGIQLLVHVPDNHSHPSAKSARITNTIRGFRLRRFIPRTLALILVPLAVAAYFLSIWLLFLGPTDPVKYRPFNEIWIYYSWFVASVFGLNISRYGLIGVEASMLQKPFWQVKSAMRLLMHSGSTWAGPGGWLKCVTSIVRQQKSLAGRLWYLLAFISILPLVAFPLSGLAMELSDGYVWSSAPPMVVGRDWVSFHRREWEQTTTRGTEVWRAASATIPGIGLAYSPPHLDRSQFEFSNTLPNSLSVGSGVPDVFLAPQANSPISGKTWGLRLAYNCSVVESASEFTILSQKSSSNDISAYTRPDHNTVLIIRTPLDNGTIYVFNSTRVKGGDNLYGYTELGVSNTAGSTTTYDGSEPSFGLDDHFEPDILEYALWQVRFTGSYGGDDMFDFDATINPSIADMGQPIIQDSNGEYVANRTFFAMPNVKDNPNPAYHIANYAPAGDLSRYIHTLAPPIGVRCVRTSALGTAEVDAQTTTFRAFEKSPSPLFSYEFSEGRTPRFGFTAAKILEGTYFEIFSSTSSPPPTALSNSAFYANFVQPQTLLQSIMEAHAVDALQLMYDGVASLNGAYLNPDLTSSKPGKILETGVLPPAVPAILLAVWAVACTLLGLRYGFSRRWAESLDGYSFFCFGADFADDIRDTPDLLSTRDLDKCAKLWALPGMIGDSRVRSDVGHISLVRRENVADPRKLYT